MNSNATSSRHVKLMTWNINGLLPTLANMKLDKRFKGLRGFLQHYGADIACMQEVKLTEKALTREVVCLEEMESFWAISRARPSYSGVTTWASVDLAPLSAEADSLEGGGSSELDREGRYVLTDHGAFVLLNVYVPNLGNGEPGRWDAKCRFLELLKGKMDSLRAAGRSVIAAGDFNVCIDPKDVHETYRTVTKFEDHYTPRETQAMTALVRDYPDVWRHLHPDASDGFTVWNEKTSARAFNAGHRIDFFLVSPDLLDRVVSCEIITDVPPKWSDHAPVVLELRDIPPVPRHPPCICGGSDLGKTISAKFSDRVQKSIKSLFTKAAPVAASGATSGKAAKRGATPAAPLAPGNAVDSSGAQSQDQGAAALPEVTQQQRGATESQGGVRACTREVSIGGDAGLPAAKRQKTSEGGTSQCTAAPLGTTADVSEQQQVAAQQGAVAAAAAANQEDMGDADQEVKAGSKPMEPSQSTSRPASTALPQPVPKASQSSGKGGKPSVSKKGDSGGAGTHGGAVKGQKSIAAFFRSKPSSQAKASSN